MMSRFTAYGRLNTVLAALVLSPLAGPAIALAATPQTASSSTAAEQPFLAENDAAMTKMMDDMAIKPSGDIDRDFVGMMAPHHQGAIDMAQAELRYGHNEQLRRIAQEIIVEQQQEILAMRIALGLPLPPPAPAPDKQKPSAASPESSTQSPGKSADTMPMNMSMPMNHNKEP
jgi:hypothetical protein